MGKLDQDDKVAILGSAVLLATGFIIAAYGSPALGKQITILELRAKAAMIAAQQERADNMRRQVAELLDPRNFEHAANLSRGAVITIKAAQRLAL